MVNRIGKSGKARVDIAENIRSIEDEEGKTSYVADVYSVEAGWTPNLATRVENNLAAWKAKAEQEEEKEQSPQMRIAALESENAMLRECILEMSEIVYQ